MGLRQIYARILAESLLVAVVLLSAGCSSPDQHFAFVQRKAEEHAELTFGVELKTGEGEWELSICALGIQLYSTNPEPLPEKKTPACVESNRENCAVLSLTKR